MEEKLSDLYAQHLNALNADRMPSGCAFDPTLGTGGIWVDLENIARQWVEDIEDFKIESDDIPKPLNGEKITSCGILLGRKVYITGTKEEATRFWRLLAEYLNNFRPSIGFGEPDEPAPKKTEIPTLHVGSKFEILGSDGVFTVERVRTARGRLTSSVRIEAVDKTVESDTTFCL